MQLSQRVSTFKDAAEQENPLKKAENEYISLVLKKECKDSNKQGPSDQGEEEKKTSLGKFSYTNRLNYLLHSCSKWPRFHVVIYSCFVHIWFKDWFVTSRPKRNIFDKLIT